METNELHPEVLAILEQIPDKNIRKLYAQLIHTDLRVELQKIVAERLVRGRLGYSNEELNDRRQKIEDAYDAVTPEQRKAAEAKVRKKLDAGNANAVRTIEELDHGVQNIIDEATKLKNEKRWIVEAGVMNAMGLGKGATGTFVVELRHGAIVSATKIEKTTPTFLGRIKNFFKGQALLFKELFA